MISVVIPVHNRRSELKKALESVFKQTYQDFEIIVVDDCSDDHPESLSSELNDTRLKFIRNKNKSSANIARNIGIKEAKGDYVAMLDSDDEWMPVHLEDKLKFIIDTNADGIFGSVKIFNGNIYRTKISRPLEEKERMADYLLSGGFAQTSTHFYKTAAINDILFNEKIRDHDDLDLAVRFSKKYKFIADQNVTAIVNWRVDVKRNVDYLSQISFIETYKQEIEPLTYARHNIIMYGRAVKSGAASSIIQHYKRESLRHIKLISLTDYMTFAAPQNIFSKIAARFAFALRVIFAGNN